MVSPKLRSRSWRRVQKRTPGGRNVTHYEREKPSKAQCGNCGAALSGVPRELPYKMRTMPKTKKRPERPYGGVLCSPCMREKIVEQARQQ